MTTKKLSLITVTLLLCAVLFSCKTNKAERLEEEEENGKLSLQDRMDLAWAQEFEMTKDPSLGIVPSERLSQAWEYTKQISARTNAALNMTWNELGPNNWGGRSRAICVDLNDATRKTVFVGSVGGGLWKTTDITSSTPNWQPVNEFFGNIAISSIAQNTITPQTMYFSTGEGYGNIDAIRGLGVWKTTNGGTTWTQLSSTNNSSFYYCQKVFVSKSGAVFVATRTGLYRSTNDGSTFTRVLGTGLGITGANSNVAYDIEETGNEILYASLAGSMHKSTDGGVSWSSALTLGIPATRIEIATASNNNNYVYALCESNSQVSGIVLSTNAGNSFTTKTEPVDADTGIPATDFSRTQAWYDLTIEVDPNDANTLFVGGIDIFKSTDAASTWQQVSHWYGGFGYQEVHADQHNIIFSPGSSSVIYFLNDGGVYRSTNGTAIIPTISSRNTNYATLQYYGCAMSPEADTYNFLAGAQDNGSHKYTTSTLQSTTRVTGGDGAFCHIDQNQSQFWYSSYVYNNYYRSTNGGTSFSSANHGDNGRFINPTDYDDVANIMYCARGASEFLRWENPQTGSTFSIIPLTTLAGTVSAVKVSPNTANRVFMGAGNGNLVRVDNANTATPNATLISSGLPAAYISCVEVETGNDNHLLVTYSSYGTNSVWETFNGGTSWTSVEGNLPDMPIRWILFNPNNNNQAVIATELGVWSTDDLNGSSTVWGSSNTGLANVRVDMLQVRQSDKLIIAATHGRGLYYSGAFAPPTANFVLGSAVAYQNSNISFTNTSFNATSYLWNFGDGNTSTQANPTKSYANPGTYNITLSINGGVSVVMKSITVLPKRGTPYTLAQGGNFETAFTDFAVDTKSGTAWVSGNSTVSGKNGTNSGSLAWVTGLTGNYVNNSESYLYTPAYNFTQVGTYNFSFFTKYNCEADYDGFRVEYSTNLGSSWQPLGTTRLVNWYNFTNASGVTAFPTGQAFFSGVFGTSFAQKTYDISSLSGNANVCFRFAFKTDEGVVAPGVAIDDMQITGPSNLVPLQLLNFSAVKNGVNANIFWSTTQEKNVAEFVIERSNNGINFSPIAHLPANNGFTTINQYQYVDKVGAVNGTTAFYRVVMKDKDGSSNTTGVVKLHWNFDKQEISISPNPFTNTLYITGTETVTKAELFNMEGKRIFMAINPVNNQVNVPSSLPKGSYVIKIHSSNGIVSKKVLKQ